MITPEQRPRSTRRSRTSLQTRQKLRAVQLDLNRDIDRLETEMRLFNIVLVPALLTILAIVHWYRAARRRRARARR